MAYTIISQNNTTTTLQDENGNIIYVPGHVTLATSTDYTITGVNNNTATLTDGSGKVIRDVPCVVVLAGGGSSDTHNKGYFATQAALEEAYPTAEAGDYAILGSTDTVWVWDEDGSAWVDSDTKGEVTSVNGQTGAVTLTIPDTVQYSVMPTAGADNEGDIVQFTGTTDANYTNGYFYKCVSDGQTPATYSWTRVDVQPAPEALPSQTGQSGKFLTTDGTDASWSDKPLVNTATASDSLSVGVAGLSSSTYSVSIVPVSSTTWVVGEYATAVGAYATAQNNESTAIGARTMATGKGGVSIGFRASVAQQEGVAIGNLASASKWGVAIGCGCQAAAQGAIQLGGPVKTNSDANTFKVGNNNGNYEMMSADGTIPTARLTKVNTTVTLAAADWSSNTQTVTVNGVTSTSVVLVAPDPSDTADYVAAGILCTSQATNSLTFTATTTPTSDIVVNVVCL